NRQLAAAIPMGGGFGGGPGGPMDGVAKNGAAMRRESDRFADGKEAEQLREGQAGPMGAGPEPTVRKNFIDTAYWNAALTTDAKGMAEVSLTMPEQLTGWKV